MIKLVNRHTKQYFFTELDVSWTAFFFGAWVPLYRGEIRQFWLFFLLDIVTFGIYNCFMFFNFNKGFVRRKLQNGWSPAHESDKQMILACGIASPESMEELGNTEEFSDRYEPRRGGFYILFTIAVIVGALAIRNHLFYN